MGGEGALGACGSQPRGACGAGAGGGGSGDAAGRGARRVLAVRAWLHGGDEHDAGGNGRDRRADRHGGVPRLAGASSWAARGPVEPSGAVCAGAGAPLLAGHRARPDRRRRQRTRSARLGWPRLGARALRQPRCRSRRSRAHELFRQRCARTGCCRGCARAVGRRLGHHLCCGVAAHGRVRAHVDGRRERFAVAQDRVVPALAQRRPRCGRAAPRDTAGAIERRCFVGGPGVGATGQPAAQRPRRCGGSAEPLPRRHRPCARGRREHLGAAGESDLDGDRGDVLRRAADVGRRSGHPRRHHDRRLPRVHPGHRHSHHRRGRRHHRRGRRGRPAVCGAAGRRRRPRACLLRPRRHASHRHRRPAGAGPSAARQVGRRHARPRHRRRPRGHRHPCGRPARHDRRGGSGGHRGGGRAAPAQRHRAHLDRAGPLASALHDGGRGRCRPYARGLGGGGARLRARVRAS